jgi:hypothetical protein
MVTIASSCERKSGVACVTRKTATNSTRIGEATLGHTRLGPLPKSRSWNQVVESLTGSGLRQYAVSSSASRVNIVAAETLKAARTTLARASHDPGVRYTFYLLTQIVLASRDPDWRSELDEHGIFLSDQSSVFDLTAQVQGAIDRYISGTALGATDLSEMAQQAAGEALTSLLAAQTPSIFGDSELKDLKNALRSLSTKKGFGQLGQKFFARFIARFMNFHLSRATAAGLGAPRLQNLGYIGEFNEALTTHCEESARIVRDFCGDWYSKTEYKQGIDLENLARFLAIAVKKLKSELQQQGSAA